VWQQQQQQLWLKGLCAETIKLAVKNKSVNGKIVYEQFKSGIHLTAAL